MLDSTATFRETMNLDVVWNHGAPGEPPIQVHALSENTYILRQSKRVSYEAPFLYLLFGSRRAVLLDTGATADPMRFPLRETIDDIVRDWGTRHPSGAFELVVGHTHAHGDHIAGDGQFADRADTVVVDHDVDAVKAFFQIADWPNGTGTLDLGERVLTVLPVPGHHPASVAVYDPWSGIVLAGDTILPGRLYVRDYPAFVQSIARLTEFADTHPISAVLGCHIEMSTMPRHDYPLGATYQPREAPLPLSQEHLSRILQASQTAARPGIYRFDDFVIVHGQSTKIVLALLLRGLLWKIGHQLKRTPE